VQSILWGLIDFLFITPVVANEEMSDDDLLKLIGQSFALASSAPEKRNCAEAITDIVKSREGAIQRPVRSRLIKLAAPSINRLPEPVPFQRI